SPDSVPPSAAVSPPATRRRWLRLSLRGMFLLTTLAACMLAWVVSQIRERDALLESLRSRGVSTNLVFQGRRRVSRPVAWLAPASWFSPVNSISFPGGTLNAAEREHLQQVFPEAELIEYYPSIQVLP